MTMWTGHCSWIILILLIADTKCRDFRLQFIGGVIEMTRKWLTAKSKQLTVFSDPTKNILENKTEELYSIAQSNFFAALCNIFAIFRPFCDIIVAM